MILLWPLARVFKKNTIDSCRKIFEKSNLDSLDTSDTLLILLLAHHDERLTALIEE